MKKLVTAAVISFFALGSSLAWAQSGQMMGNHLARGVATVAKTADLKMRFTWALVSNSL